MPRCLAMVSYPDAVIATAEQDILKHEASGTALRPSQGASQQSGWKMAQSRNNSPGGSLAGLGVEDEDGVEALTLVFHAQRDQAL